MPEDDFFVVDETSPVNLSELCNKISRVLAVENLAVLRGQPIDDLDFRLGNFEFDEVGILRSKDGKNLPGAELLEEVTLSNGISRNVYGSRSLENQDTFFGVNYRMTITKKGEISVEDYFKKYLRPLLLDYNPNCDHNEIHKHVAYLDHLSATKFSVSLDYAAKGKTTAWRRLKQFLNQPDHLCNVTSQKLIDSLSFLFKSHILQIWLLCPYLHSELVPDRHGSFYNSLKLETALKAGESNFRAIGYQMAIDYDKPIIIRSPDRTVC